ncbi:MAG: hypothetical protein R3C11_05445 [Planctomycetaceae bacterium]
MRVSDDLQAAAKEGQPANVTLMLQTAEPINSGSVKLQLNGQFVENPTTENDWSRYQVPPN